MTAMTANLRSLVGYIDTGVRRLAQASDELTQLSSGSLGESQRQRAEAEQTACAMQEVTASTRSVAEDSAGASRAALQANDMARQGEQLVRRMIGQVHQLSGGMRQTADSIAQLERESRASVDVLGVIKALAEQTNLLALNAAIEAARAGEQGRGFAVVADGVRGLAGRTRSSAGEIEATIQSWLQVTTRVVAEMNDGLALGDTCVELAEDAGRLLERIMSEVSAIEARISQIAAATEQQSVVAAQVSDSALRVQEMAQSSVEHTRQIDSATQDLARLGDDLQQLTRQFRNVD
ncbi:methyl-accepting chemotaxis protein [Pseudomonas citronellolis]